MKKSTLLLLAAATVFSVAKGTPKVSAQIDTTSTEAYEVLENIGVDNINNPDDSIKDALSLESLGLEVIDSLVNKNIFELEFEFEDKNNKKKSVYFTVTDNGEYKAIHMLYDQLTEFDFVWMGDKFIVRKDSDVIFDSGEEDFDSKNKDMEEAFGILDAIKNQIESN